jgi:hypothetical protein
MNSENRTDAQEAERQQQLIAILSQSAWFMEALTTVRALNLDAWCIGAGTIRNLVWDALHGRTSVSPSTESDVDVAYFDAADLSAERDAQWQARLAAALPAVPWEVTNQAGVHQWFEATFGHAVAPLQSLEKAVASWPEYATSVGVSLAADDSLRIIAPHGLHDLFAIVVRRNPIRVSLDTYRQRIAQKRYAERWPKVRVEPG